MRILIIEDEMPAARRLRSLCEELRDDSEVLAVIDSVKGAVKWLRNFPAPDLILMDIQLADGVSFDIFKHVEPESPIIFTTAYDQYLMDAFKVNSVDYLLKPISREDLKQALEKYERFHRGNSESSQDQIRQLLGQLATGSNFKKRFLVKKGQELIQIPVDAIAYFYSEDGLSFIITGDGQRNTIDQTLDELEGKLDPEVFFRVNRGYIIQVDAIGRIHKYFNQRLKLDLNPGGECLVSRERVRSFKEWLDR